MNDQENDGPMLARSGITGMREKCDIVLKTNIPYSVDSKFKAMASEAGCTPAELMRDLLCLVTHGSTFGEMAANSRRSILQAEGRELAQFMVRDLMTEPTPMRRAA